MMKKLLRQLHVNESTGRKKQAGTAPARRMSRREGKRRQRACSLLMALCMTAGLLSPMGPLVREALAAAAQPQAGETYYFDLSAAAIPGTVNTALPDTTLHYVPFVYAGSVNAYSLRSGSNGSTTGSATAAANTTDLNSNIGYRSARTLFVADYNVTLGATWDALNSNSLIFGKNYQGGNYLLRAPSGGSAGSAAGADVTPDSNEWSVLNTAGRLNNMGGNSAWAQDTLASNSGYRILRGQSGNAASFSNVGTNYTGAAYRPVLENLKTAADLSVVTLHLNGGSFNKSTGDVKIVCSGTSYTAPSSTGLVRPVNNTLSGFYWNTAADGSGTSYAEGATVPADVTALYAQWKPEEQFNLPAGQTYYFDMSEDKVTLGGTTNAALPDTSRHYVPFTYVGTINAYRLNPSGFKSGTGASATAANNTTDLNSNFGYRYDHSLFISQYNVINSQSCNVLAWTYSHNGTYDNGKYRLRMPTGGYTSNSAAAQTPLSNEWDQILNKSGSESNDGWIKNWSGIFSFVQDFYSYSDSGSTIVMRGGSTTSPRCGGTTGWTSSNTTYGYRPVLEVLDPATVGKDGLKAVTLHLNGGTLGSTGKAADIQVVCDGTSFTAPSETGLTRPAGNTGTGFYWNTVQDGTGTSYAPGDTVPGTVTNLYAQWTAKDTTTEQFTLETGVTYYFDLSAKKASLGGTANSALPDSTWHYVPFTYTGTVNAYKLNYGQQAYAANASRYAAAATDPTATYGYCYDHSLFIADRNLTNNLTYNSLQYGWTHGNGNTLDNGNYQMRMPTGGYDVTNGSSGQFPSSNEWDQIIRKSGTTDNAAGWIKNWKDNYSYVQDVYYYGNSSTYNIETRGNTSALSGTGYYYNSSNASYGYRPVLEVLNPAAVKTNGGLKAVTLDLNGGTFNGSTDDIKVVCAGASFTAPSFTGLTRPANSATFGFHWNTAKDGTGTAYEAGDTVPNTVTKLYAQWTTDDSAEEQFTLATGKTYYFDLSGTKLNSTGGTTNTKLPDTSLRYVPFTYTGTVDAYALKSAANGVSTASETASSKSADAGTNYGYRYKHSLFVADYTVRTGVSWDSLNQNSLIFGTAYDTNYTLRALSGGNQGTRITDGTMGVIGTGTSGWPVANEWDQIISKSGSTSSSDGWIKNWSGIYTWVQDTYYNNTSNRTLRGNQSATAVDNASSGSGYNYLPALEVSSKLTDNADALKAVTLNLNGGKFNGSTDSIQVVCAGDSFTAPSGQSLTRPTSVTTAGFHWNTQADGKGTDYQAGEAVPNSVTTLYAQYYTAQKVTEQFTLPVGGTYYFDLSSASGSGALNSSLPDSSCHYVPFTYTGTVSAYVLNGKSEGNTNSSVEAAAKTDAAATYGYTYDHSLFVSDYNIRTNMSWYSAYLAGVSMDGGNYNMRYMSGGSSKMDTLLGTGASPVNNEWDQILNKSGTTDGSTGLLKNWNGSYSWTQDTYSSNSSYRSLRSSTSTTASAYNYDQAGTAGSFGFRPVLEVSKALTADSASLKVVTLHLNGGKLNGKTDNINIICAGSTFTAPNALGLTRPDGTAASTCWWSTEADGKGDYYAIGDKVPSTVTDLYANWNVREQYDLANGSVYYFDLSSYSANTSNSGTSALTYGGKSYGYEDGTRHYVPFTYVGTINAYALKSGFQDPSSSSYAANSTDPTYSYGYRYDHSLFVSSVPVTTNSQWNTFGALKGSPNYGNQNFTLRSMSAGSESGTAMATPVTNEFDQIIQKNSDWGTNLLYVPGWQFMQDTTNTYYTDSNTRLYYMTLRGNMTAGGSKWEKTTYGAYWCWRPVLEVNNANVKTSDAMTAVTLNLNGGTLDGNKEIKMLRVNGDFTVPGGTGLTRPTGNATQYFTWNTKEDGTGTTYVKGDTLPAGVNTLYAQWSPIEQFSLANGGTYYFDLSGQGITGTMNSSLPDTTLHYVPFTYTGTQYSYVLKDGSNNNPNSTATASGTEDAENAAGHRYDHSLFVSDYPVSVSTRTALYNAGLMFGKDYQTNYSLRSMSGGTYANSNNGAYDYINEWDQILNKSGSVDNTNGWLKYWKDNWTWVQDTNAASSYVLRGNGAARNSALNDGNNSYNYHPVLEVLKAAALGKDGLTAVTLNLNGGTLGTTKSAADIKIICAGETYTAPSATGIVRPNGNGSYFMWNTKQDGSGKDYAPGDTVPKSVTALYAQWTVTQEQITTLPVGNTYYFDLSGLKSYNNLGTVTNANPDQTWHYVPFTFDGTVYAYSLNKAAQGDNTATAAASGTTYADAVKGRTYAHSLFTGNYLLTTGAVWNNLNAAGLIYGTTYQDGQYSLRTLSGGINSTTVGLNNEFDAVGSKKANNALFSTWAGNWAYTQDNTDTATATVRNAAANSTSRGYTTIATANSSYNYVPSLEVMDATASFTPVTLDLNGGSLGSNKTIQIVCTGQSYTAPSGVGLTRPSGNVDTAFHWNTKADNSGTNYKPGAAVPSTVTTLYAQWTPVEQYTLPVGETYYFDFSGQTFPGTQNTALPDATLHYVPMTYGGTVNAYVLNSNSSGVDGSSGTAAGTTDSTNAKYGYRYDHSVFVSDYTLTTATSWNALNTANLIFGTDFGGGAYTLRVPSGGYNSTYTTTTSGNEWDAVYRKNNTYLKNLGVWNWMQDTYSSYRVVRGNTGTNIANDAQTTNDTFRPLLEAKSASMTPVTLNLNGGSLGTTKSTADIKIVCTGDTYTAPSKDGLTRPAGDTDTYFMWNTQADGNGDSYAPGAKVSASVTTLYAQWNNGFTVNFTDAGITGMTDCYAMTGEQVRPAVEVKYNAANSTVPKDAYQVTYENNVNAGTATVKIVGATMGTLTKTFTILYDMSAAKLTLLNPLSGTANAYAFSGSTVKPTVSLKLGTQEIPSTAYTVRYTGNTTASTSVSAPTATVTVTPAGDNWVNSAVTKSADFSLVKAPEITTDNSKTYQNAFKGSEYTMQLKATGTGPITWSYTGTLPLGLSLDAATGVISGTPTEAGTYTATISAKNAADTATKEFTWKIGTVGGRMTYTDGTGAEGVTVTFKQGDAAGTEIAAATTDADGYYQASIASSVTSAYVMFTPPELQPYSVRMQTNDQAVTIKADGTVINGTLLRSVKITLNPGNGTLADEIYANVYCYPGDELDWMTEEAKPTPNDASKHFIGWFTTATGSTEAPEICPSADATYYAQYSDKIYTVLYDTDGGGTISPKGVDLTNANLLPEKNPTKEGYTFDKWVVVGNESYNLTSATKFSELVAGTGDQKVYLKAKWTIRSDIQVTLDANGSTDYPAAVDGGDTKTYTAQTYGTTISYPTPVRDGYTFLGWSTQKTAEAAVNDDKPVTSLKVPGENATYYAIWATATNTVTYDAMGGSFAANVTGSYTGKIGESYVIPTTTRTGYTFKGWFTTPGGSVSAPADGKIPTRSATYYAQWTAVTVTVTLNASGAAPETQTVTGKYGETVRFTAPQKSGYSFSGWKANDTTDMFLTFPAQNTTYQAVFTAGNVAVVYNPNGGTFTDSETGVRNGNTGESYTAPAADSVTRTGYDFVGWYTTLEGTTKAPTTTTFPPANVTYYAKWTPKTVEVTLNAGDGKFGGDTSTAIIPGTYGTVLTYTAPTREGYAFLGWKVSGTSGDAQMFLTVPATPTTYEAVWLQGGSTVTFDPMGGSFADGETGVRTGKTNNTYTAPTDPTRSGYTFAGWYTGATDGTKVENPNTYPSDSNTTYYAQWTASDVTVTLDAGENGTIKTSKYTGKYGDELAYTTPTYTGFTFKGWKLSTELDSAARTSLTYPATNTTYIAVWAANDITVTFDANGGKIGESTTSGTSGAPLESVTLPANPTREGYDFAGWYTSPTTGTKQTSIRFGYTDATYYAHWTAKQITVTMDANGGTMTPTSYTGDYGAVIEYTMPTKDGSAFVGWNSTGTDDGTATMFPTYPAANGTTLIAVWKTGEVNLTFNPMGGTFASGETGVRTGAAGSTYSKPADPTRTGYTFKGWYTDADCTTAATVGTTLPTESANTVYYAKWAPVSIKVTLNANDGTSASTDYTGTYGATILYTAPTRTGYTFAGWADSASATSGDMFPTYPSADKTLYAVWTANTVTLTFDANGGKIGTDETAAKTGNAESSYTAPDAPTRTGYTFDGWYDAKTGGTKKTLTGKLPTVTTTLYAHWTAETITVTLKLNGGSINSSTADVTATGSYGATINYTMPVRSGYAFKGWADSDSAAAGVMFPTYETSKTLYAVWSASTVTVTFDAMGGTVSGSSFSGTPGGTYTPPTVTRTGYTFTDWYTTPSGNTKATGLGTFPTADAACYAHWTVNTVSVTLNLNGGNISGSKADVSKSGDYGTAIDYTAPTRAGYTFKGWATDKSATTGSMSPTYTTDGTTYYAVWSAGDITVTFEPMGGTLAASDTGSFTGKTGGTYEVSTNGPTPTRTGYTFLGWFTTSSGSDKATGIGTFPETSVTYYAHWQINHPTVTLKSPDGTPNEKIYAGDYGTVVEYTVPTRAGYTFKGWKLTGNDDGTAKLNLTYPAENTTYYAVWVAGGVTVTFEPMGGTLTGETSFVGETDGHYAAPGTPTRTGYAFLGWFTKSTGGEKATAFGTYPAASTTYYAQWKINTCTVTLKSPDGSPDTQSVTGDYGTVVSYKIPVRTGYSFGGWKIENSSTAPQMSLTIPETSKNYVAVWVTGENTVTFDPNGGKFTDSTETGKRSGGYGVGYTLPAAPTRTGYDFAGWYTSLDFTTAAPTTHTFPPANVTYYAKWTAKSVTITLNAGTGAEPATQTLENQSYGAVLKYTVPTRDGFAFIGWKVRDTDDDSTAQMFLTVPAETTSYVAAWKEGGSTVSFDPMGGAFAENETGVRIKDTSDTYTTPVDPTRSGYTFAGWYTGATDGDAVGDTVLGKFPTASNTTYFAHWNASQITVTLDPNDGSTQAATAEGTYGTSVSYTTPTRGGYTFSGWKLAGEENSAARMSLTFPATDTTYVAVWTANSITVTFDANGGKLDGTDTQTVGGVPQGSFTAPTPARTGYTFEGWYTSPSVGTKLTDFQFGYTNATYYAHWSASEITVTLNPNGGSIDGAQTAATRKGSYGAPIQYTIPTKAGCAFVGWRLTNDESAAATMFPTYPSENADYTAVWAASQVNLTYNPMGGSFAGDETGTRTGAAGSTYTAPVNPARTGYTFDGWYTDTNCTTPAPTELTLPTASNTMYYAKWTSGTVTVKLDPNGGKIDGSAEIVTKTGTYGTTVDYGQMTLDGSQFMGWKVKGSSDNAKRSLTFPAQDAEYVAVWTDAVTVSVKYSANGGTLGGTDTYTGTPGQTWTAPGVEDRPGYTFLGWGLDPFNTTAIDHKQGAEKTFTTQSATTYYALWQATDLTITLNPNGGKFGESTESVDKTGTIGQQLLYTIPAKDGYTFCGWAETDSATDGNMFPTFTVALNGKPLYAVWKAGVVNVAFFAMGGSDNAVLSGKVGDSVAIPADPTRTGYTFEGWYTEPDGGGNKLDTATGGSITLATATPAAYYAKWTAETYTVTLKLNGGNISGETADVTRDGAYGAQVTYTEPTRPGYTFTGWKAEGSDTVTKFITFPAKDAAYTAQWQKNSITVTFNSMDGSDAAVLSGEAGSTLTVPADPTRTGYTFDGWSLQPISTSYVTPDDSFPTASIAYYAQWTAKTSAVTLKLNGGTIKDKKEDVTLTGSYGSVVAYTAPTRSGYTFSGWKPEGGKDEEAVLYLTYPLEDTTGYEAVWKAIPSGGGGGISGGAGTGTDGTTVTVPVSSTEGNTHAAVTVEGGTATVSATEEQIKAVISDTEKTGTVVVDVSNLDVSSAVVPSAIVSAARTAEGGTGLKVALPTGTVTLDETALNSTNGSDVKIEVQPVAPSELNDAQKEKLGAQAESATIVDVNVYVNDVLTHTFNDGKVDVSVPYTLKPG